MMLITSHKAHYSNNKKSRKDAAKDSKMNISLTRVYLECLIAYYLSGHNQAKNVLIHYSSKVSVKNKKTINLIVDRLELYEPHAQNEYFRLLADCENLA